MCHEPTNISPVESEITFPELDHLPLTTRRSLLQSSESVSQRITASVSPSNVDSIMRREEEEEDGDCFNEPARICSFQGVVSNCDASESVDSEMLESTSIGCSNDSGNLSPRNNTLLCRSDAEENPNRVEQSEDTAGDDVLEHLTLKERRSMLRERIALSLPESNLEDDTKGCDDTDLYKVKAEILSENGIALSSEVQFSGFLEKIDSVLCTKISIGSESRIPVSGIQESDIPIAHESSFGLSPKANLPELSTGDYEHSPLASNCYAAATERPRNSVKRVKRNPLPLNVSEMQPNQVKTEPLDNCVVENNDERNPVTSEKVKVKREVENHDEAHDENELDSVKLSDRLNHRTSAQNPFRFVKTEAETTSELDEDDEIDHMKLIDRLKLRSFHGSGHNEDLNSPSSGFSFRTSDEYVKPLKILRPWKRKRTATDSIETALEEDAPGLLQLLMQQGVSVDELRLYGDNEGGDDSSDDSLLDESFSELEDVISQLFFKRETGSKILNLTFSKASRTSYCLTCLFSLIEQARYLQFLKWPVEWGWCRDLQSFIFVFERHNRIVMERPEYGYATYFFELSNTASIRWQIKRLVLAMKLASCGRYQLIENKPLLVGEDMTEGEAEVMTKYGWVANTGLGTMLNYRDRVYHDRKSGKETSEWRSKISNLLVDGYNSGTIVSTFIAPHDVDVDVDVDVDIDAGLDNIGDVKLESY